MNAKVKRLFDLLVPVSKQYIFFESEGDFCDNARALYEYMLKKGYDRQYHFIWRVHDVEYFRKHYAHKNVKFVSRESHLGTLQFYYYVAKCKFFFFTHPYWLTEWKANQTVMALWHGTALKAGKGGCMGKKVYDYACITSEHFRKSQAKFLGCEEDALVSLGYPRNDILCETQDGKTIRERLDIPQQQKLIVWMPTFRNGKNIDETYFTSQTGLPLLEDVEALAWWDAELGKRQMQAIVKMHHLQKAPETTGEFANIRFMYDEELLERNVQLYELLAVSDSLLTDYSSVSLDYLLCHRKIGFILDDKEAYEKSRGFAVDNIDDYFPGLHVLRREDMAHYLDYIQDEADPDRQGREQLIEKTYQGQEEGACARILDFLSINV